MRLRALCAGYSSTRTLAPGDSVVDATARVVAGSPGGFALEVNQLRAPEYGAPLELDVRRR